MHTMVLTQAHTYMQPTSAGTSAIAKLEVQQEVSHMMWKER
jgi:hypothetical protein